MKQLLSETNLPVGAEVNKAARSVLIGAIKGRAGMSRDEKEFCLLVALFPHSRALL